MEIEKILKWRKVEIGIGCGPSFIIIKNITVILKL
jgi:hypothetical protein